MVELPEWFKWVIGISFLVTFITGIFIGYYSQQVGILLLLAMIVR